MGQRSNGRKGWGGTGLTPSTLNDVYSFGSFWIPAGALTPVNGIPCIIETYDSTGAANHWTWTVAKFLASAKSSAEFTWAFKSDFVGAPDASLKLRCAPIFFTKTSADSAVNIVRWDIGAVNMVMGDDINIIANTEVTMLSTVQPISTTAGQMLINGGDADNKQAVPLTIVNGAVGTTISSSGLNLLNINLERSSQDSEDTFADDVFLLGINVQFAVDFNNIAEWPDT